MRCLPGIIFLWLITLFCLGALAIEPEADCSACHQKVYMDWQQSDHAKAMNIADEDSVLGDFSGVEIEHYSQRATFFVKDHIYFTELTEGGETRTYQVKYTFGHYPLQQYLIEKNNGRLHVFPFAWDARPLVKGGQRWYANYAEEDIQAADRLHWQQPLQNWNGMCADCHSDGLKRNYNLNSDSFATHWDNINVGCQSCHSEAADHTKVKNRLASIKGLDKTDSHRITLSHNDKQTLGQWLLGPNEKIAHWQGETRDNSFMDTCFACHALRSPLSDGIVTNSAFLDQFTPSLIAAPLYHADGQIKQEVYVYGSFLQSKMFSAGVNCLDCHDAHTMKVQTQTNALCLQCHNAEFYQQPKHLRHEADSGGGQCINCHMPKTTYMGVDDRRDHSFSIPRPDLSSQYATPNACNQCHQDQSTQWAAKASAHWYGKPAALSLAEQGFRDLMQHIYLPQKQHIALVNDETLSVIKRASALKLLGNSINQLSDKQIHQWVNSDHELIRLAIAEIGYLLPAAERLLSYKQLLGDKYKAIRVAAANQLLMAGLHNNLVFEQAFKELLISNEVNQWRGEGNLNQSLVYMQLQQNDRAIDVLKHGIKVDPYFEPNYINLADIYRVAAQPDLELATLKQALHTLPNSALFHYSYGMWLIRKQQKAKAVSEFSQAVKLAPQNVQYAYIYFLALDGNSETMRAVRELKSALGQYSNDPQLIQLGLGFAQKLKDRAAFEYFQQRQQG